ncbi:MAG: CDP-alcohol phosphatidyltransferase family protein [Varibaculum sp.]|nr:CDP-alcohol phosphatidyltransferase family protein [Varibaculum sp.]
MLGNHGRKGLQRVMDPLARLAAALHLTPNIITWGGTTLTVIFAWVFLARGYLFTGAIMLGFILLLDSLDGVLARLSGKVSDYGGFLDSTLDRVSDLAVFGALVYWAGTGMNETTLRSVSLICGLAAMVFTAAVPYARARAQTLGVDARLGIAERTDRLVIALTGCGLSGVLGLPWLYPLALALVTIASAVTLGQRVWFTATNIGVEKSDRAANTTGEVTGGQY